MAGPLAGFRIVEMAGIGPAPLACMWLADMGADVIRVDRTKGGMVMGGVPQDVVSRGRRSIAVDLKQPEGIETVLKLCESADALIEGFRPGVMEKLGLGPDAVAARNAKLVYARMTGWGQDGPLAQAAGHDINYIGITGALAAIGRAEGSGPVPPLNLLGDYGGGSMYLIAGLLAALLSAQRTGQGQVVDVAITDGVINLLSAIHGFQALGMWKNERQSNMLDGGAHYYDTYECACGGHVALGAIEPQFYAEFMARIGEPIGEGDFNAQLDQSQWPGLKAKLAGIFKTRSRDEWSALLEGTDSCFAPVLNLDEARHHPHNVARGSLVNREGIWQSAPAPRFSATPGEIGNLPPQIGADTLAILGELGYSDEQICALQAQGAVKGK